MGSVLVYVDASMTLDRDPGFQKKSILAGDMLMPYTKEKEKKAKIMCCRGDETEGVCYMVF